MGVVQKKTAAAADVIRKKTPKVVHPHRPVRCGGKRDEETRHYVVDTKPITVKVLKGPNGYDGGAEINGVNYLVGLFKKAQNPAKTEMDQDFKNCVVGNALGFSINNRFGKLVKWTALTGGTAFFLYIKLGVMKRLDSDFPDLKSPTGVMKILWEQDRNCFTLVGYGEEEKKK